MATNGTTPRAGAGALAGSAGLTPQMSIVNADLTPTVFFFRWLLNSRGAAQQTPWLSDIDAAGFNLNNLGNLTLTGSITFPDGSTQTTAAAALVPATHTVLGGVKIGANISVTADGTISVAAPSGGGTVTGVTASAPLASSGGAAPNITITSPLPVANGGTGSAAPSLIAGANVTITGAWPNQTISATGGGSGAGTVTSVALAMPAEFTVTGSPVTASGTLTAAKASQAAGLVYASPAGAAGVPVFRALAAADFSAGVVGGFQTPWLQNINAAGFQLQNAGFVGIGTSAPSQPLHVHAATNQNAGIRSFSGRVSINASNDTGGAYVPFGFDASQFDFAGGNVGIGNSAPAYPLTVAGVINSTTGGFRFPDGTTQLTAVVQTPWAQNIDAAGFSLSHITTLGIGSFGPNSGVALSVVTANPTTPATATQLRIGEVSANPAYGLNIGFYLDAGASLYKGVIQSNTSAPGPLLLNPAGGNIGIGTTAPNGALHITTLNTAGVNITAPLVLDRVYGDIGDGQDIVFGGGVGNTPNRSGIIRCYANAGGESSFGFYTQTAAGDAANHLAVTFLGNGNVGIGIAAPAATLDVAGTLHLAPTVGGVSLIQSDASSIRMNQVWFNGQAVSRGLTQGGDWSIYQLDNTHAVLQMRGSDGLFRSVTFALA